MHDNGKNVTGSVPDDIPTVCAVAVIAVSISTFSHQAIGHGGACLLLGGRINELTSVYFQCSLRSHLLAPAGPAANYLAGIVAWIVQMTLPQRASAARLLALLVMAFSLFWESGYLLFSMVAGRGDYFLAAQALLGNPQWPWRAAGVLAGVGLYMLFARVLGLSVRGFTTSAGRVSILLGSAWLAAMITAWVAAALYAPDRGGAFTRAAGEIAGAFPLLYPFNRVRATPADAAPAILRNRAWIAAAIVVFALFAATLGRGIS
jgi:hypothetical protein